MLYGSGGFKLGGGNFDNWRDTGDGSYEGAHLAANCNWNRLGHPELCDSCLLSIGITADWNISGDYLGYLGIQVDNENMEIEEMSELLGTAWWSILCVIVGVGLGVYIFPRLKDRFMK